MLAILMLACGEVEDTGTPEVDDTPDTLSYSFDLETVDFGSVELGTSTLVELTLTNTGSGNLILGDFGAEDEAVEVTAAGVFSIKPDESALIELTWSPGEPGTLDTRAWFQVGDSPSNLGEETLPVVGSADGPDLELAVEAIDMGTVTVGCSQSETIELLNLGTTDMTISALSLDYAPEYTIVADELPITVRPNDYAAVELVYTPIQTTSNVTTLYIETDDPFEPVASISVDGSGWIEADNELYWEAKERQPITILMNMNEVAVTQYHAAKLENAVEVFFTTLDDFDVQFRMACFLNESGVHQSDTLYIDHTMEAEESIEIFYDMLSGTSQTSDNDFNMETLDAALDNSMDWLFEDEFEDSKLNFFTINDDADASRTNSPSGYLAKWRALKDDEENIQVHAIAGTTIPYGSCGDVYFSKYVENIDATGGVFLDVCEANWDSHMETIAEAFIGEIQDFELTGNPAASTIEVYWDGIPQFDGWTYDSEDNEVVFDQTSYPPDGTTVRIYYIMATECPA